MERTTGVKIGIALALGGFHCVQSSDLGAQQQSAVQAASMEMMEEVTYAADVAPILLQNCERCHREGGVAPMALSSYDEVRPWASVIKEKTGLRDRAGAMPPYYVERGIGIQHFADDERLTEEEIETIARWVDSGAPLGDPADLPPAVIWDNSGDWALGEPDLITRTEEFFMEAGAPDWWGDMPRVPVGLDEDRYVRAVAIREVNSIVGDAGDDTSVGGRWIVHHMIWSTRMPEPEEEEGAEGDETAAADEDDGPPTSTGWPVHELGRNPDIFHPQSGRLLRAGSEVVSNSIHLHSSGEDTSAILEIGWYLHPRDYEPEYDDGGISLGDGMNIDIRGGQEGYQELHTYTVLEDHVKMVTFEPHLHGPGARMCLEMIWGSQIETINCVGYDHNWVKQYTYDQDHAPLMPKGTILRMVGYMDMSEDSPNVPDPRNWQGSGNRSITNMFLELGRSVTLTDEQFVQEMHDRREKLGIGINDHVIACPLCTADLPLLPPEEEEATADADADS